MDPIVALPPNFTNFSPTVPEATGRVKRKEKERGKENCAGDGM
jgi:hypothetical protein